VHAPCARSAASLRAARVGDEGTREAVVGIPGLQARPLGGGTSIGTEMLLAFPLLWPAGRRVLPRLLSPVDRHVEQSVAVVHRLSRRCALASGAAQGRHCPIPFRPQNAGCDIGPVVVGACAGAESGAGIRFQGQGSAGPPASRRFVSRRSARRDSALASHRVSGLEFFAMCGAAATPTAGQRSRSRGDADVADFNACQQAGRDPSIVEPVDVARSLCELHSVHIALLQNRSELICTDRRVARAMVGASRHGNSQLPPAAEFV
jgi:hypothetical protein